MITSTLDVPDLRPLALVNQSAYCSAQPFAHIIFDDFFPPPLLESVLEEFPDPSIGLGQNFNNKYEKKSASLGEAQFGEFTKSFMRYLNSEPFLEFLEMLTGIQNLIPDPHFEGGGCHRIESGGFLKVHVDFNKHSKTLLDRRLNVLIYLNKNWQESYGGHLELWDKEMTKAYKRILPIFNRVVVFSTTNSSCHGHPEPLTSPPGYSRKSLALYYYTHTTPASGKLGSHSTLFQLRPGMDHDARDPLWKMILKETLPPFLVKKGRKIRRKFRKILNLPL